MTLVKLIASVLLAGVLSFSMIACKSSNGGADITNLNGIRSFLQSQGRPYQKIYSAKVGETQTNVFFAWTVKSVTTLNTLVTFSGDEVVPIFQTETGEEYRFIIVSTTVKNTFERLLPVGNYDFYIVYEYKGKLVEDRSYDQFTAGMYPDDTTLAIGASVSGNVIFEAPRVVTTVYICYYEIFDNDSMGDTYIYEVKL